MIQLFLLLISFCFVKNLVCMEVSALKNKDQFFPNDLISSVTGGYRMFRGKTQNCILSEPSAIAVNDWIKKNPQHVINYAKNHDLEVLSEKTVNELELLRQSFEEQKKIQLKCDTLKNELEEKEKLILELNQNVKGHKDQEKAAADLRQKLIMAKSELLEDAKKLKVIEESNQRENLRLKKQNTNLLQLNKELSVFKDELIEEVKKVNEKLKQFSEKVQFEPINKVLDDIRDNLVHRKEQLKTRNMSKFVELNSRNSEQKRDKTLSEPLTLKKSHVNKQEQLQEAELLDSFNESSKKEEDINPLDKQIIAQLDQKIASLESHYQNYVSELTNELKTLNGKYVILSEKHENTSKELESSKTALTNFKEMNNLLLKKLENNALNFDNINVKHQESITEVGKLRTDFKNSISRLENEKIKLQEESTQKDKFIANSKILNYVLILGISLFSCRNLIKNGFCKIWELRHAIPLVSFKKPNITLSGFSNPFAHVDIANQIALRWALLRNYIGI